jgi:uncharacterized protein YkwD
MNPQTTSTAGHQILATVVSSPASAPTSDLETLSVAAEPSSSARGVPTKARVRATPTASPIPTTRQPLAPQPPPQEKAPAPKKPTVSCATGGSSIANAVFNLLNCERAANHLGPLRWSSQLVSSAHAHNEAMISTNTFSHQVPGEAGLGDRISATGLNWTWVGENIAWSSVSSTSAADSLEASMYNEKPPDDGHRLNILTTQGTMVGIDVVTDSTGKMWITEDFGN